MKTWRLTDLSLFVEIVAFKTLTITKIVHLALVANVPSSRVSLLNKIKAEVCGMSII